MTSLEACASSLRAWQSSQTAVLVGAPEDDMKEVPIIDLDLLRTFEGDEATLFFIEVALLYGQIC